MDQDQTALKVNGYTFRGSNFTILIFASLLNETQLLTLLHSEQPKLCGVLAVLKAIGLRGRILFLEFFSLCVDPILDGCVIHGNKQKVTELSAFVKITEKSWSSNQTH